jgi:hypothetical protein
MDWYLKFAWAFIILAGISILSYYVIYKVDKCTSDPLKYAADEFKAAYGEDYKVYGTIMVVGALRTEVTFFGDSNSTDLNNNYLFSDNLKNINISA